MTPADRAVLSGLQAATDSYLSIRVRSGQQAAHEAMQKAFDEWGVPGLHPVERAQLQLYEMYVTYRSQLRPYEGMCMYNKYCC